MRAQSVEYNRFDKGIDVRKSNTVSDANRLRELQNAYVTDGWAIRKRPGLRKVTELAEATNGLVQVQGDLFTLSSRVNAVNADESIGNIRVPLSSSPNEDIQKIHNTEVFNGQLYASILYSNGVTEHSYNGTAVTDANCPQSKSFVKLASRIYAIDGDVVRMSTVNDPTDWTDNAAGAGFLPTGLQAPGDDEALGVAEYDGQLVVFMVDSIQIWAVDPDPAQHALIKIVRNIGTRYPQTVGNYSNDIIFLSDYGFRSISRQQFTDNREDNDIGSAIDLLVRPILDVLQLRKSPTSPNNDNSIFFGPFLPDSLDLSQITDIENDIRAVYYPRGGQYWCLINKTAYVFTYSRSASVNAWSTYTFDRLFDDLISVKGDLYLRSNNELFIVDEDAYSDDGVPFNVRAVMSYQAQKAVGVGKFYQGFDISQVGKSKIAFLTNVNDPEERTEQIDIDGNTRPGAVNPVTFISTGAAIEIENEDDEEFQLDSIILYFRKLGVHI